MTILHLKGKINDKGKLELELPPGLPEDKVLITLEIPDEKGAPYHMTIRYAPPVTNILTQKPE